MREEGDEHDMPTNKEVQRKDHWNIICVIYRRFHSQPICFHDVDDDCEGESQYTREPEVSPRFEMLTNWKQNTDKIDIVDSLGLNTLLGAY